MPRKRLPRSLPAHETASLVEAATSPRDRLAVQLGLCCGLRVSEIVKLEVPDIDCASGQVLVRHGKGDKDRVVPFPAWLGEELRAYLGARASGYVFPGSKPGSHVSVRTIQRLMRRLARKAGLADADAPRRANPHRLRHTFATTLLRSGTDIVELRDLLGHSSIATTQVYLSADGSRLKAAVERAFGQEKKAA